MKTKNIKVLRWESWELYKLSTCNEVRPSCKEFLERNLIFPENLKVIVWGDPSKYPSAKSNLVNPGKNLSADVIADFTTLGESHIVWPSPVPLQTH